MYCVNSDDPTVLVSGGGRHRWVSMCVALTFKMTEKIEQWICIKFCVKLEHSSVGTIWMIQKVTTMGNWWLVASHDNVTPHASHLVQSFFGEISNHPGDSAPYSPDVFPYAFCFFPKLKSPLKGKRFQTSNEIHNNMIRQLMVIGRTM